MTTSRRSETSRLTYAWLATCALTIGSALVAANDRRRDVANVAVGLVVLGFAAAKAWLLLQEFMEVRLAPRWLRLFAVVWLSGLTTAIVVLYLQ